VLLPLGFCHGDDAFLEQLAKDSQAAFHFVKRQSIFEMMSVIAASDLFLGTSLHGNITAFAFGIPHVIGPIPVDKCAGFLDVVGLPAELKAASWTQAGVKLDMAAGLGGAFFRDRAVAARKRINETVDLLVKAVG
jgi:polysaccharide pyruvyl transferase WcaK-like protein